MTTCLTSSVFQTRLLLTNLLPVMLSLSSLLTVCSVVSYLLNSQLTIATDTHYDIAKYAIEHGMHVLVTKPAVQLLKHHQELIELAQKHKVVCFVEHHKRYATHPLFLCRELTRMLVVSTRSTATPRPRRRLSANATSSAHG